MSGSRGGKTLSETILMMCGPSGVGKTTFLNRLSEWMGEHGESFSIMPTYTTRPRRPEDTDDGPYRFIDEATFLRGLDEGGVLEHDQFKGHYYGTLEASLEPIGIVAKAITVPGLRQVLQCVDRHKVVTVRLVANRSDLALRLDGRGETAEFIAQRLEGVPDNGMDWESDFDGLWDMTIYNHAVQARMECIVQGLGQALVAHREWWAWENDPL